MEVALRYKLLRLLTLFTWLKLLILLILLQLAPPPRRRRRRSLWSSYRQLVELAWFLAGLPKTTEIAADH